MFRKVLVILVVCVAVFAAVMKYMGRDNGAIEVQVETAGRRTVDSLVFAAGKVQPVKKVKISAKIAGEIMQINVGKGDLVNTGDLLVQLDRESSEADLLMAESSYLTEKARLTLAANELKRKEALFRKKMVSLSSVEEVQNQYEIAVNNAKRAKAALVRSKTNLEKSTLRSPISGKVLDVLKEKGEIALGSDVSSDTLLIIADMSRQKVIVKVNENDIVRIRPGASVKVNVDAVGDRKIRGEVREIGNIAINDNEGSVKAVTSFEVVVMLDKVHPDILPGMSANVEILSARHEDVVAVPIQCVTIRPKGKVKDQPAADTGDSDMVEVVFKVVEDRVVAVPVVTGLVSEKYFEIESGLNEGDLIVSGSYRAVSRELEDGSLILIKDARDVEEG